MSLKPSIPPGEQLSLPCMYQLKVTCNQFESLWKKSTWYTKVTQMYEHIAYELRYEHLSSIKHGSMCMKAQNI